MELKLNLKLELKCELPLQLEMNPKLKLKLVLELMTHHSPKSSFGKWLEHCAESVLQVLKAHCNFQNVAFRV